MEFPAGKADAKEKRSARGGVEALHTTMRNYSPRREALVFRGAGDYTWDFHGPLQRGSLWRPLLAGLCTMGHRTIRKLRIPKNVAWRRSRRYFYYGAGGSGGGGEGGRPLFLTIEISIPRAGSLRKPGPTGQTARISRPRGLCDGPGTRRGRGKIHGLNRREMLATSAFNGPKQ